MTGNDWGAHDPDSRAKVESAVDHFPIGGTNTTRSDAHYDLMGLRTVGLDFLFRHSAVARQSDERTQLQLISPSSRARMAR
jgi:hypothetical protein